MQRRRYESGPTEQEARDILLERHLHIAYGLIKLDSIQHNTDKLVQQLFNERPIQYKRGTDIKLTCEGVKREIN